MKPKGVAMSDADNPARPPTHAGGVVFRRRDAQVEFLLVEARHHSGIWLLPKGRVEPEEAPSQTATREVREEAGIEAWVLQPLETVDYHRASGVIVVAFFLLEACAEAQPSDPHARAWLTGDQAVTRLHRPETKAILRKAMKMLQIDTDPDPSI